MIGLLKPAIHEKVVQKSSFSMIWSFFVLSVVVGVAEPIQGSGSLLGKYGKFDPALPKTRAEFRKTRFEALNFLDKNHSLNFFVDSNQIRVKYGEKEFGLNIDQNSADFHEEKFVEWACALYQFIEKYQNTKKTKEGKHQFLAKGIPSLVVLGGIASGVVAGKVDFENATICSIVASIITGGLQFWSDKLFEEIQRARGKGQESDHIIKRLLKDYKEIPAIFDALCSIVPSATKYEEDPGQIRKHLPKSWRAGLNKGRTSLYEFLERTQEEREQQEESYAYLKREFNLMIEGTKTNISNRNLTVTLELFDFSGNKRSLTVTSPVKIPANTTNKKEDEIVAEQLNGFFHALYVYLAHYHDIRQAYESRNSFCKKTNQTIIWLGNVASSILFAAKYNIESYVVILGMSFLNLIGHMIATFHYESKIHQAYKHRTFADERLAQFLSFFGDMKDVQKLLAEIIYNTIRSPSGSECQQKMPATWGAGLSEFYKKTEEKRGIA